ncbi:MAG: GNAT family N-acetyltransferase [Verrucomicrobiia bacterium]|jgi:predicted N-acetyltransferase YhbS
MAERDIRYSAVEPVTPSQYIDVLQRSGFAERRPADDFECIRAMVANANLLVTAWHGAQLIGVARSVTDFAYCCYLSDLAVDEKFQKSGIGRQLIHETRLRLGPRCRIVLLAAPKAVDYYPKVGFTRHDSAWVLPPLKGP